MKALKLDNDSTLKAYKELDNSCIAFGVFDGFHRAHQYIVNCVISEAKKLGVSSVILSFDKDPDDILHPKKTKKIMCNQQRITALEQSGVDHVALLPFTKQLAKQDWEKFLNTVFSNFQPLSIHVGSNFNFGARAQGNVSNLESWAKKRGVRVRSYELLQENGQIISSTRIRNLLKNGNVRRAAKLLGRPYVFQGKVEQGDNLGTSLGFATANMFVPENLQALNVGVYSAYARVVTNCTSAHADNCWSTRYKTAVAFGPSPFFGRNRFICEAHLLDFEGSLYGKNIQLEFVDFLRPMKKFACKEDLINAINSDIAFVRTMP